MCLCVCARNCKLSVFQAKKKKMLFAWGMSVDIDAHLTKSTKFALSHPQHNKNSIGTIHLEFSHAIELQSTQETIGSAATIQPLGPFVNPRCPPPCFDFYPP